MHGMPYYGKYVRRWKSNYFPCMETLINGVKFRVKNQLLIGFDSKISLFLCFCSKYDDVVAPL